MSSPDTQFISITETRPGGGGAPPPPKAGVKSLPEILPILGLSDIVVFPGMVVPLLVESAPSIRLIDDVVAGDRFVGMVLQKRPEIENPLPEDLFEVGCAARVLRMLKFPDNTARVLVEGLRRIRVGAYESRDPYLRARHDTLKDVNDDSLESAALARNVREQFQQIIELSPALTDQVKVAALNTEDPGTLADLVTANLNLNLEERQRLLETPVVKERLARLVPLLARETEVLQLGSKIQKEVTDSMSKSQRDYFLREQIRAIQRELGETDATGSEVEGLRAQVEQAGLPDEPKQVALKELERLKQMPPAVAEYTVTRNYLDWIINLPWTK